MPRVTSYRSRLTMTLGHSSRTSFRDSLFNLTVQEGEAGQVEQIRNVSVTPGHPRQVDKVLLAESRLVQMTVGRPPTRKPTSLRQVPR